jgi:hypothetical protein
LENYGPVGERREKDLAGRPVDTDAVLPGGVQASGFAGVQTYIRQHRQDGYLTISAANCVLCAQPVTGHFG